MQLQTGSTNDEQHNYTTKEKCSNLCLEVSTNEPIYLHDQYSPRTDEIHIAMKD